MPYGRTYSTTLGLSVSTLGADSSLFLERLQGYQAALKLRPGLTTIGNSTASRQLLGGTAYDAAAAVHARSRAKKG